MGKKREISGALEGRRRRMGQRWNDMSTPAAEDSLWDADAPTASLFVIDAARPAASLSMIEFFF